MSEPRACCVVRRDGELLVEERVDPDAGERVFRPLGRHVGDDAAESALEAEFSSVLGVELVAASALGTFDGVRVLEGSIREAWPYAESGFTVYDPDVGETTRVCWLHVDDFRKYGETLAPEGLLDAL
ncbi:hypothetical protein [Halobacterium wangiae]|uniref:hypothetical protein n=1 Tax=Halobacterium wangiae TaxID=2902623 RepID=UPI001E5B1254|nr:hypothetical protein [Halobacterium wangiae]